MTSETRARHTQPVASHNTPPSPQVAPSLEQQARSALSSAQDTIKHAQSELPHVAEQLKERANVVGEQIKVQAEGAARTIREELAFIRKKFTGSRLRDHVLQLGAAMIVVTIMHLVFNAVSHQLPVSSRVFLMYLEHWQPGAFLLGLTLMSRAVDHLKPAEQYAWSIVAMCWTTAILGWSSFPFGGILEKAAISLPLNARNFVWMAFLSPAINATVKKIRQF